MALRTSDSIQFLLWSKSLLQIRSNPEPKRTSFSSGYQIKKHRIITSTCSLQVGFSWISLVYSWLNQTWKYRLFNFARLEEICIFMKSLAASTMVHASWPLTTGTWHFNIYWVFFFKHLLVTSDCCMIACHSRNSPIKNLEWVFD